MLISDLWSQTSSSASSLQANHVHNRGMQRLLYFSNQIDGAETQ